MSDSHGERGHGVGGQCNLKGSVLELSTGLPVKHRRVEAHCAALGRTYDGETDTMGEYLITVMTGTTQLSYVVSVPGMTTSPASLTIEVGSSQVGQEIDMDNMTV